MAKVLVLPPREQRWLGQEAIAATVKARFAPMHPRKATKSKKKSTQADADAATQKLPCREIANFHAATYTKSAHAARLGRRR